MDDLDDKLVIVRLDDPEDQGRDTEALVTRQLWMKPPSFSDTRMSRLRGATILGGIAIAAILIGLHWLLSKFT